MTTRKITAAEKKDMNLVDSALRGDRKAIAEFDRIHGKGEFDRRCDRLLRTVFETPAPVKDVKKKVAPEMGLGYGMGVGAMKQTAVADCIGAIDGSIDALKALTGNSDEFKQLSSEWKALSLTLRKLGRKKAVKKETGKAGAKAPVKAGGKTTEKKATTVKITRREADAAKPQRNPAPQVTQDPQLPSSVKIADREMELHLGSFGARPLAEHDASELIGHPMVFWYRRGVFPDPRQSRVNPTVIEAKVVERKGKAFRAAPFTVHVKIGMAGDAAHCRSWAKGVLARNKGDQE